MMIVGFWSLLFLARLLATVEGFLHHPCCHRPTVVPFRGPQNLRLSPLVYTRHRQHAILQKSRTFPLLFATAAVNGEDNNPDLKEDEDDEIRKEESLPMIGDEEAELDLVDLSSSSDEYIGQSTQPIDTGTATATTTTNYDIRRFRCASYLLVQAAGIGILSGWSVGIFKILIDTVKHIAYAGTALSTAGTSSFRAWQRLVWLPLIPTMGGLLVSLLRQLGGGFPPGLKDTIQSVDNESVDNSCDIDWTAAPSIEDCHPIFRQFRFIKKSFAAIITLGTGSSLGPEGPAVEIGINLSRLIMDIFPTQKPPSTEADPNEYSLQQRRLLLACGAAAGVSAGFNAPLAGAFFALEIVQKTFASIDKKRAKEQTSTQDSTFAMPPSTAITTPTLNASGSISAILLSSVLSALVCQSLLGEHLHLALKDYSINTPLLELPLYLLLGATSGLVAFLFGQATNASRSLFQGRLGPKFLQRRFARMSPLAKPALGGLICGLVGLVFPQILFNGFDTMNIALANRMLPTLLLLSLLGVKMFTTAVAAGSGLVGGTFAPSLFLGGMVGAAFHNIVSWLLENAAHHGTGGIALASPMLQMADLPAYTMVGAATVLAAVFRAPLTASLLLFELTRDYGAILPLMASSGVASVVGDILEAKQEAKGRR